MYVVDITRENDEHINMNDILIGKDSMDAKRKTIDYIINYTFVNTGITIDKDTIDQGLDMGGFSLKDFLRENYGENITKDLLIQAFPTKKDFFLFVKIFDKKKSNFPTIYAFHKNDYRIADKIKRFLINDYLIVNCSDGLKTIGRRNHAFSIKDDPSIVNIIKGDFLSSKIIKDDIFISNDFYCGKISLYNDKEYCLNALLNSDYSLNQLRNKNKADINI